ncbi:MULTISPECIES: hypothetical protein [Micromonospora]|uniref:hypothetical protein n=1 Tax=Micromonospora TaxID=1873 RepID=UPI00098D4E5D|nr:MULTISPECIES: hypothetical protein [unclassified Micromonospora]MDI5939450.1 hypothetical protein [Micromonospora sp. DH15]OON28880.1 hypothetical protein BSA16_24265 [Micromonospora sp. Rc5]
MTTDETCDDPASVRELVRAYDRARAAADELGPLVWTRSRPCAWWSLRLPRSTLLTRFYLSRHIDRSLGALVRGYNAREALGTLDDAMQRDRDLCAAYRRSLRIPSQLVAVLAYGMAALVIAQVLVSKSEEFEDTLAWIVAVHAAEFEQVDTDLARETLGLAAKTVSGSPATLVDVVDRSMDMSVLTGFVALAAAVFVVYVTTRMLVPAFRLKRQLLCLADQAEFGVRDTATGWFVDKSVGAYARERAVFRAVGARPPAEWPVDLIILAGPPILLLCIAVGYARFEAGFLYPLTVSSWFLAAAALRARWLDTCRRGRNIAAPLGGGTGAVGANPPFVVRVAGGRHVEGRAVPEVAALPVLAAILVPFVLNVVVIRPFYYVENAVASALEVVVPAFLPWLVAGSWHRLAKTTRQIEGTLRAGARGRGPLRAWASVVLFVSVVLAPVVVTRDLWALGGLLHDRPRRNRARRLAALGVVVPLLNLLFLKLVSTSLAAVGPLHPPRTGWLFALTGSLVVLGYGALLGAVQWAQNLLLPTCGELTAFGRCDGPGRQ